jgi:hypothetical protein
MLMLVEGSHSRALSFSKRSKLGFSQMGRGKNMEELIGSLVLVLSQEVAHITSLYSIIKNLT